MAHELTSRCVVVISVATRTDPPHSHALPRARTLHVVLPRYAALAAVENSLGGTTSTQQAEQEDDPPAAGRFAEVSTRTPS